MNKLVSPIPRSIRRKPVVPFLSVSVLLFFPAGLLAQEITPGDPDLIFEPIGYTDVIDGFEVDDSFDLNISLKYLATHSDGTIWREQRAPATSEADHRDIAKFIHMVHQLVFGLEVGIYSDLMAYSRLPIVLSDTRELSSIGSRDPVRVVNVESSASAAGQESVVLFGLPFVAPVRSGIPEIDLGIAWGITNQYRAPYLPTWVVRLESRWSVGEVLRASCDKPSAALDCHGSPGITSGYHGLRLESRTSYRYRYLEPYLGAALQLQWAGLSSYYFLPSLEQDGDRVRSDEVINSGPPDEIEAVVGLSILPWEYPGDFQRFILDFRFNAVWVTEGRDRTPLFDALGASRAEPLAGTQIELLDPTDEARAGDAPFYGLTDVQSHARFGARMALIMQAARYLRLMIGMGLGYTTPHLLTATKKCVLDRSMSEGEDPDPRCPDGGVLNRNYRDAIDRAGQRFGLGGNLTVDVFTQALGTF
ncbi:MAG: hypothetical protein JXA30_12640 [Deltaproteobacteria bacterium]|nr:hypothetical protein [Deltaproteobacteria bacterium]